MFLVPGMGVSTSWLDSFGRPKIHRQDLNIPHTLIPGDLWTIAADGHSHCSSKSNKHTASHETEINTDADIEPAADVFSCVTSSHIRCSLSFWWVRKSELDRMHLLARRCVAGVLEHKHNS